MQTTRRRLLFSLLAIGYCATNAAVADDLYPNRPIRMIVPYAPGGSTDFVARILARRLGEKLGQQVFVVNKPGGATMIGLDLVATSSPDGYTIGIANIALGADPSLFAKLPFDPQKDLVPVSLTVKLPLVLVGNPSLPAKSVPELIALAKAKPGVLNYGSAGNGSATHLGSELFKYMTGTDIMSIPYSGGGPAIMALIGGQVSMVLSSIPAALPFIKSGQLVALGVSGSKRNPALPDVPTIAEAGVPGFEVSEWQGVVVAKGTPRAIVDRLNKAIVSTVTTQEFRDQVAAGVGGDVVGSTPEELAEHIANELAKWPKVIKAAGIKAQ